MGYDNGEDGRGKRVGLLGEGRRGGQEAGGRRHCVHAAQRLAEREARERMLITVARVKARAVGGLRSLAVQDGSI